MDKFLTLHFTTPKIRLINNWRVFFKVMYLSEICSAFWSKINATHQSALRWPNQPEPGKRVSACGLIVYKLVSTQPVAVESIITLAIGYPLINCVLPQNVRSIINHLHHYYFAWTKTVSLHLFHLKSCHHQPSCNKTHS
jgi:hypothetical protein